jgi:hypothetical protein
LSKYGPTQSVELVHARSSPTFSMRYLRNFTCQWKCSSTLSKMAQYGMPKMGVD